MKKIITVMLCIVLVLLFAGCGKNGDTSKVEIDYGTSSVYSKEEIDSAIEIIKKQFASFEGCELHSLSYMPDEECNNANNIECTNEGNQQIFHFKSAQNVVLHLKAVSVRRKRVAVHGKLTKNTLGHGGLHGVKAENGI